MRGTRAAARAPARRLRATDGGGVCGISGVCARRWSARAEAAALLGAMQTIESRGDAGEVGDADVGDAVSDADAQLAAAAYALAARLPAPPRTVEGESAQARPTSPGAASAAGTDGGASVAASEAAVTGAAGDDDGVASPLRVCLEQEEARMRRLLATCRRTLDGLREAALGPSRAHPNL